MVMVGEPYFSFQAWLCHKERMGLGDPGGKARKARR